MHSSPSQADIDKVLEIFGYSQGTDTPDALMQEMREVEQAARRLTGTLLRPREFSEAAALAEASASAQAILVKLHRDR